MGVRRHRKELRVKALPPIRQHFDRVGEGFSVKGNAFLCKCADIVEDRLRNGSSF
jgi:hypothetical protein